MQLKDIGNGTKPFPYFLLVHPLFKGTDLLDKVFPKIGLANCQEKLDIKLETLPDQKVLLNSSIEAWKTAFKINNGGVKFKDFNHGDLYERATLWHLLHLVQNNLSTALVNDRSLYLTKTLYDADRKSLIKTGTDLTKYTQKLFKRGMKYAKGEIIDPTVILQDLKTAKIHFSSDEMQGAWDIATMSMRGIKSCVRWEGPQQNTLIGSILDPGCGIIYLTNEKSRSVNGSKMLFRAIVRFAIYNLTEPVLILEKNYTPYYKSSGATRAFDKEIRGYFISFLEKKVNKKFRIIDSTSPSFASFYYHLPTFKLFNSLKLDERPYCDSKIGYNNQFIYGEPSFEKLLPMEQSVKATKKKKKKDAHASV